MTGRPDGTLVDRWLSLERCDPRLGARFLDRRGEASFHSYAAVFEAASRAAGALVARGLEPGDRVAILLPTSLEFLSTFLGVQLAGGVPAALYPPVRLGRLDEYFARTARMLDLIGARFLVTDRRIRQVVGPAVEPVRSLAGSIDAADLAAGGRWSPPRVDPDAPAFLQFSSGTTGRPKAVIVSHRNALANLAMIDSFFGGLTPEESERGGVCWLPLYHDMGLLGCMLQGLYHPGTMTYLGPEVFVTRPAAWLQALSRYRALVSPAPNFAYGLCAARVRDADMEGVDLSNWRFALNGAEPIDIDVMRRFTERFARWGFRPEAMTPVYGLAEAGLAVSFSDPSAPPAVAEFDRGTLAEGRRAARGRGRRLVSVGRPMPGLEIVVRDGEGRAATDGEVGTVTVRGPSITRGYFNDPGGSARAVRDGWLDTGDLGFVADGELFIAGRKKDVVIVRGRNYAPQEIEEPLSPIAGVRAGCVIAVGDAVEGLGEQLVILAERDARVERPDAAIESDIRQRLSEALSLAPDRVLLLAPGTLPRTSSGKLRRRAALEQLRADDLSAPRRLGALGLLAVTLRSWLAWGRLRLRH